MRKIFVFMLLFAACTSRAQIVTAPKSVPTKDTALQSTLEKLIQSGSPADMDKAFATLKEHFTQNAKQTEPTFKNLKNLLGTLAASSAHGQDMLDILAAAKGAKAVKNAAGQFNDIGYLWALQVITLYHMDKPDQAAAAFEDGLFKELGKQMCGDILKDWPLVFKKTEKQDEYIAILQKIEKTCWDMETIEQALKKRMDAENAAGKPQDALADAKRFFNICTMAHTANAILVVDKQLAIADKSKTQPFRDQQTAGASAPADPMDAADAKKCSVFLDIKLDGQADKQALESQDNGDTVDGLLHPAVVYLLIGQPEKALEICQKAQAMAVDPADAASVAAMIARCIKAQDGTVGRANAYMVGKPTVAPPPSKSKPNQSPQTETP